MSTGDAYKTLKRKTETSKINGNGPESKPSSVFKEATSGAKISPGRVAETVGSIRDTLDRVLTKGIFIDAWLSISVIGLRIMDIEAKVTVTSMETSIRYAEALGQTLRMPLPG